MVTAEWYLEGLGAGGVELLFIVYEVSVWEDEKVLEVGGGDRHITMWMDLVWLYT